MAAKRSYPTSKVMGSSQECKADSAGMAERSYPKSKVGGMAERSYPTSEVRGGGREHQLHVQGAVAARAQEGLEELSHVEGQEGQL